MEDEHFITWMRTAGLADLRKIWGRIQLLEPGNYSVEIENKFDVSKYKGSKTFVISSTNKLGG